MVKIAILLLFLSISFLNAKKLQVIASFNIIADIAKNVAKDSADVQSLTKLGTEIHSYEPTPKDIL
ncbi:MAG: metal ABC transporter solute-binding protein, Zn/Mn family, partial [Campylobacter hyointestinalis]